MILSAKYGGNGTYIDVTNKINNELPDEFIVSNDNFTDPAYGVVKHLVINFTNGMCKIYAEHAKINKNILLNKIFPIECTLGISSYKILLDGKKGLEIGGPSQSFYDLGIYNSPSSLDNVVLPDSSTPNNNIQLYNFYKKLIPGLEYNADVVDLSIFKEATYNFIFASHILERLVNPLKALKEITRIIKPKGLLILVLPWKQETGDHKREITQFSHLLEHYKDNRDETDVRDHLYDIICNYDVSKDPTVNSLGQLVERSLNHYENRELHVHVFDFELIKKCLEFFSYEIVDAQLVYPEHQIVLAKLTI